MSFPPNMFLLKVLQNNKVNKPIIRTLLFFVIFVLVVVLPWWISTTILAVLTIYLPLYVEVLFFGFLFDTLYSVDSTFPYLGLTLATAILLIVMFVNTKIRR